MSDKHVFTEYCEICKKTVKHPFEKKQLQKRGGGLYSGIFLHKDKDNNGIHAALAYFDGNLSHRGTESSTFIQTELSPRDLEQGILPSLKDEFDIKQNIKTFYEWVINEYIFYFKSIRLLALKQVSPILSEILERFQSDIYRNFELISDGKNERINFDLNKQNDSDVKNNELRHAYQLLFNQIRTYFRKNDESDALEASKKLGLKMVTLWKELIKLRLSEDIYRTLEVLLTLKDYSEQ